MIDIKVIASGSSGNCYQIEDGHSRLLLEAGIPIERIKEALDYQLSAVSGVLISHEHQDHAKAAVKMAACGIDIYTSAGTAKAVGLTGHRVHRVSAGKAFDVDDFKVIPFPAKHDAAEPLGFYIHCGLSDENVLFFTDTYYLEYLFTDVDYIIAECNYSKAILQDNLENGVVNKVLYERIYRSHMSLETLMEFLYLIEKKRLKKVILAHMSDANSDAALFKKEIQKITGVEVIVT